MKVDRRRREELSEEPPDRQEDRFEWKHRCAGCPTVISTDWRFCLRCEFRRSWIEREDKRWQHVAAPDPAERRKRSYGDDDWPQDAAFDCGCTSSSNPDVSAKDWFPPDPECLACRGTGRLRDKHHYLTKGRRPAAAPDVSIEKGSYEHAMSVVDSVIAAAVYEEDAAEWDRLDDLDVEHPDLQQGGWNIKTLGPEVPHRSGERAPKGPSPKGIRDHEQIREEANRLLWEDADVLDAYWDYGLEVHVRNGGRKQQKDALRRFQEVMTNRGDFNRDALAEVSGVPLRTVQRRAKDSAEVARVSLQDEENMTTAERLERIELKLDKLIVDSTTTVERLQAKFPNDIEVSEAVDRFLDDVLTHTP